MLECIGTALTLSKHLDEYLVGFFFSLGKNYIVLLNLYFEKFILIYVRVPTHKTAIY